MFESIKYYLLFDAHYLVIFTITVGYFLFLYFGLGFVFDKTCDFLTKHKWLNRIVQDRATAKQIQSEMQYSLGSILMFGVTSVLLIALVRHQYFTLLPDSLTNTLLGVTILTLWNEVYFFIIHRLMHTPFMMRRFHYIHHRSVIPTVFSVYSFHWLEAFLLGNVPLTLAPFVPFSAMTLVFYPLASISINFAGHCNHRFGNGDGSRWLTFGTVHNTHHAKGAKKYGFATFLLDSIHSKIFNK
jgi:Delta7-sterol 5-desaturase